MSLPKAPPPMMLGEIDLQERDFRYRVIDALNFLLAVATVSVPETAPVSEGTGGRGSGGTGGGGGGSTPPSSAVLRVPNSLGLRQGELVNYSQSTINRASQTGSFATHICVGTDGGLALLQSASPSAKVVLDGQGSGPLVYLGTSGRGTLQRPSPTADGSVWEQIIGTRIDNLTSGLVSVATNLPASVPIKV